MIDLTPLDVRKKSGDFKKAMRGYEIQAVDSFLELVADRLEDLVKENLTLRERATVLQAQVELQIGREKAVQDALVTAQSLRDEIKDQARREAEMIRREAEAEGRRIVEQSAREVEDRRGALDQLERRRDLFLTALRRFLARELDVVSLEQSGGVPEDQTIELELQGGSRAGSMLGDPTRRGPTGEGELWLGVADEPAPPAADSERAG